MATVTMVRTVCCQGYLTFGKRCSLCPHRAENQQAIEEYKAAVRGGSLRRAVSACEPGLSGTAAGPDSLLLASAAPAWTSAADKS